MSTDFSNSENLPPKLKYKMAAKLQSAIDLEGSSSAPKKSPTPIINETGPRCLKHKSASLENFEKDTNSSPPKRHKGGSSKSRGKRPINCVFKGKAAVIGLDDFDWTDDIEFCPTYFPTREEFEDPMGYLQKISAEAVEFGICKIVSPVGPSLPPSLVLEKENKPEKFRAECLSLDARYRETIIKSKRYHTVDSFATMANEKFMRRYKQSVPLPPSLVERDFWKKIAQDNGGNVEYANGIKASAFSSDPSDPLGRSKWNLQKFSRLDQSSLRLLDREIEGVTDPLLYLGMLFSYIYWSAEPGHLYSIEYHHYGAPRTWYVTPGSAAYNFEEVVKEFVFPENRLQKYEAYDILNFKTMLFSPKVMLKNDIPIFKTVQYPGEFIITFPKAYHMAINHGFNCWEEAHFATPHWFPFGDEASERRALYIRPEIVPYQELLCKEAMYMFVNKKSDLESHSYRDMKVNFAALIRLHRFACKEIKRRGGATVKITPYSDEIMHCGACSRECHLAYVKCRCFPMPICIFHDMYNECPCQENRIMFVREEFTKMESVALSFQSDDDEALLAEVEHLVSIRRDTMRMKLEGSLLKYVASKQKNLEGHPFYDMKQSRANMSSKKRVEVAICL